MSLRPWVWPAVVLALIIAGVVVWNRQGRTVAGLTREVEAARFVAAGLAVEVERGGRDLEAAADRETLLAEQLAKAKATTPGVKVIEVVRWRTVPGVAGVAGVAGEPASLPGACLLAAGDTGEVRVSEARLEGPAGSQVVVAAAEAWRILPEPAARLFGGEIQTPVPVAVVDVERPLPRWGAGLAAFAGPGGWAAGPAVAFPPLRIWGWAGEVVAGAGVGPTGTWQAGGTAIVRW